MKGLLIKEFYSMKSVLKQYGLILLAMGVWCCFTKNPAFFPMITTMYGAMLTLTSMSYDETVHFDKYEMTLPLGKSQVVVSKYMLLCVLTLAGAAVGMAIDGGMRMVVSEVKGTFFEDLLSTGAVMALFLLTFSILLPMIFKLGVEKGRLIMVVIYFLTFGALFGVASLIKENEAMVGVIVMTKGSPAVLVFLLLAVMALVLCVSCLVSVEIVKRKEW